MWEFVGYFLFDLGVEGVVEVEGVVYEICVYDGFDVGDEVLDCVCVGFVWFFVLIVFVLVECEYVVFGFGQFVYLVGQYLVVVCI